MSEKSANRTLAFKRRKKGDSSTGAGYSCAGKVLDLLERMQQKTSRYDDIPPDFKAGFWLQYVDMKLFFLLLVAGTAFAAEWDAIQRIPVDQKIEITTRKGTSTRGAFVSASGESIVVREKSGQRSVARSDIRRVRVADPSRRLRNGLIWTAVGAAAGAAIGAAVCPYCPNEGHGYTFIGPGLGIGAGAGALSFLPTPYRTVYKSK